MNKADLQKLLNNFDDGQFETIAMIVVRIAAISAEKFTGQTTFSVNSHMGSLGDTHVNRGEIFRPQKKRVVRSGGL